LEATHSLTRMTLNSCGGSVDFILFLELKEPNPCD